MCSEGLEVMKNVSTSKLIHFRMASSPSALFAESSKETDWASKQFFGNFWPFFLSLQNMIMKCIQNQSREEQSEHRDSPRAVSLPLTTPARGRLTTQPPGRLSDTVLSHPTCHSDLMTRKRRPQLEFSVALMDDTPVGDSAIFM